MQHQQIIIRWSDSTLQGQCFFACVARALLGDGDRFVEVREATADWLAHHWNDYIDSFDTEGDLPTDPATRESLVKDDKLDFDKFLELLKDGSLARPFCIEASHPLIAACAEACNVCFCIVETGQPTASDSTTGVSLSCVRCTTHPMEEDKPFSRPWVVLKKEGEQHYKLMAFPRGV